MSNSILRISGVIQRTQLSRSQIYLMIQRGEFPAPIKLSTRCSGWLEADLEAWIESRMELRAGQGA